MKNDKPLWWRHGHEVFQEVTQAWKFTLILGVVISQTEEESDCIDEQLWAVREGLA